MIEDARGCSEMNGFGKDLLEEEIDMERERELERSPEPWVLWGSGWDFARSLMGVRESFPAGQISRSTVEDFPESAES